MNQVADVRMRFICVGEDDLKFLPPGNDVIAVLPILASLTFRNGLAAIA